MFAIALVIFREVLEISLIVGVLLAATRGLPKRGPWVLLGFLGGIAGACLIAFFADAISSAFEGVGQEVTNACILLCAASLIGWTVIWMAKHARQINQEFRLLGQHVVCGVKPIHTLAVVVALSVWREGAEIVMFLYSAVITKTAVSELIIGALMGASVGAMIGMVIYFGLMKIPLAKIFTVTTSLLVLLVAGMVSQAAHFLIMAGKLPEIIPNVWDTSWLLKDSTLVGQMMHVLVGYTASPSLVQVLLYAITATALFLLVKINSPKFVTKITQPAN